MLLFYMVDGGRFEAFPRGVHEIWSEVNRRREENGLNLAVEKRLALVYRMPMYFFVSRGNEKLAYHLEKGLMKALSNGTFDGYFFNNPDVKNLLEKSDFANRKIFELNNPNLPPETPLSNKLLWLDIQSLKKNNLNF